jgi:hypothetical protein
MPLVLADRRSGKDRRHAHLSPSKEADRRRVDRRQFPPVPGEPDSLTPQALEIKAAIDSYKKKRGLTRITLPQLLSTLAWLGYSKPGGARPALF